MNKLFTKFLVSCCGILIFSLSSLLFAQTTDADKREKVFYRYTDEKGVKVVSLTIPPEAISRGYDLVSFSGTLIKSVAPVSDPSHDAQLKKAAKEQAKIDADLRRNYSTPQDIDAAKARKLQQLKDTLEILQGSLISTRSQLKLHETNAANIERSGKTVPDDLLKNITMLRNQEKDIQLQLQTRDAELKTVSDKFDQDKARFILITKDTQANTPK